MGEEERKEEGNEKAEEQGKDTGVLIVRFARRGSADFGVEWHGVTATQLLAVAGYLRMLGERRIQEQWAAQAISQVKEAQELAQVQRLIKGRAS